MNRYELVNRTTGQSITDSARVYDRPLERFKGLMLQRNVPDDAAYIFDYDDIHRRGVHMIFVLNALDVVWLQRGEVEHKRTLRPFTGHDAAPADAFIEFVAGGADGIREGDRIGWARV